MGLWIWLKNPDNRGAITVLLTVIVFLVGGGWAIFKYLNRDKPVPPQILPYATGEMIGIPGQTVNIGEGAQVTINIRRDDYEARLEQRVAEIRAEIRVAEEDKRHVLEAELAAAEDKFRNLETSYTETKTRLANATAALERFKNAVPETQRQAAEAALARGETEAAETLFADLLAEGEKAATDAAEAAYQLAWLAYDRVDYAAAGARGPEDLHGKITEVLSLVELEEDVYRFGLTGTIDPDVRPEACAAVLSARAALPARLADDDAGDLVVRFDPEHYNGNATLAENLLFGTPTKPEYGAGMLAENPLVTGVLTETGLIGRMLDMGLDIARTMVEIFADLPPGHPFFDQFSFIDADDLPNFGALVAKSDKHGKETLDADEALALRRLPFDYVEARHRLGLIDRDFEAKVVAARKLIGERLAARDPGAVAFYRPDAYNAAASLQDNILFGRLAYGQAQGEEIVGRAVTEVLDRLGLRATVIEVGLDYQVGIGGKRLSPAQRQKIGLGRALLKRPEILIVNDALAVLDGASQTRLLKRILEYRADQGVIWTLQRPDSAERFDRVLVMHEGRIVEQGSFADLNKPGSALSGIMAAE